MQVVHIKNGFINKKFIVFWFKMCFLDKLKEFRLFHNYFEVKDELMAKELCWGRKAATAYTILLPFRSKKF